MRVSGKRDNEDELYDQRSRAKTTWTAVRKVLLGSSSIIISLIT